MSVAVISRAMIVAFDAAGIERMSPMSSRSGCPWFGCAYRESGELFVKIGDEYRPVASLLGKRVKPVPGVCEPAPDARS